jgi:flagellar hook-basal body complex protein FliE
MLGSALDQLNSTTSNAETLAIEGATGQANVADVTVAATEAQLAVQLATTVRNEGVTALNSIMTMQAG